VNVADFADRWQLFELEVRLESAQGAADGTATLWLSKFGFFKKKKKKKKKKTYPWSTEKKE
jgi:hypothetical protein